MIPARKITVLYFIPCLTTGGTERLVLYLNKHLDPDRFNVQVCAFRGGAFEAELAQSGKELGLVAGNGGLAGLGPVSKALAQINRLAKLESLIKRHKADIVHTHHNGPLINMFFLRLLHRSPVRWAHTEHIRQDVDRCHSANVVRLANRMARSADRVTGVSRAVCDYYRDVAGVAEDRIVCILNGVDLSRFGRVDPKAKRRELGLPEDDPLIGVVGNLRRQKNHPNLFKAFPRVLERFPTARIVLAGDGECRAELEAEAARIGIADRVHFLGFRLDANEVMAALDIYCLPSFYEGMPISILEAWAARLPVVATDVVGIAEIVEDGVNGLKVPSDSPGELADGIIRLLADSALRERVRQAGHELVTTRCTVADMVRRYEELYQELAG